MSQLLTRRTFVAVLMLSGLTFALPTSAQNGRSVKTYIALGDSIAFGHMLDPLVESYGDQGYVKLFADWLATEFDGKRPNVVNLAVYGETTTSFFTGVESLFWPYREALANENYSEETEIQAAKFLATVQAAEDARNQVKVVSFALGANDAFALANNPNFYNPELQAYLMGQMFLEIQTNYIATLEMIRQELPHAKILLPNYYNAFEVFGPSDPAYLLFETIALTHDAMIRELAAEYKAEVVDVHSAFQGHAFEYTNILLGNTHPSALGYEVIAQLMIDAYND